MGDVIRGDAKAYAPPHQIEITNCVSQPVSAALGARTSRISALEVVFGVPVDERNGILYVGKRSAVQDIPREFPNRCSFGYGTCTPVLHCLRRRRGDHTTADEMGEFEER